MSCKLKRAIEIAHFIYGEKMPSLIDGCSTVVLWVGWDGWYWMIISGYRTPTELHNNFKSRANYTVMKQTTLSTPFKRHQHQKSTVLLHQICLAHSHFIFFSPPLSCWAGQHQYLECRTVLAGFGLDREQQLRRRGRSRGKEGKISFTFILSLLMHRPTMGKSLRNATSASLNFIEMKT